MASTNSVRVLRATRPPGSGMGMGMEVEEGRVGRGGRKEGRGRPKGREGREGGGGRDGRAGKSLGRRVGREEISRSSRLLRRSWRTTRSDTVVVSVMSSLRIAVPEALNTNLRPSSSWMFFGASRSIMGVAGGTSQPSWATSSAHAAFPISEMRREIFSPPESEEEYRISFRAFGE